MIENLHVKNIALIEDLSVDFKKGFNILTGETGAGKSILVGALGLLLGNKADNNLIRTGKDEAVVSGVFRVSNHLEALEWLEERNIETEEGVILLRRTLRRQGRGAIYIQSTPVTIQELGDFTDLLVDMHSQHAHQSLLRADNHRKLLDHYCKIDDKVKQLSDDFYKLTDFKKEKEKLKQSESDREREIDYLNFSIKEINDANLKIGEDEQLEAELKIITQAEKIFSILENYNSLISESRSGALASLRNGISCLENILDIDSNKSSLLDRYQSAFYEIEDITESLISWQNSIDYSAETLDRVQQRLQIIQKLTRKHGGSIKDVLKFAEDSLVRINLLTDKSYSLEELEEQMDQLEQKIRKDAFQISEKRKKMAIELEKMVTLNLVKLGMAHAKFSIGIDTRMLDDGNPACGATGIDVIRFLFSANPGEPLKELRSIASGGELSRVMLAIKSVFSDKDPIQTLVFDEIDTGIGGAIARSIAMHINQLGKCKQILCITHLASIAAKAEFHYKIKKEMRNGLMYTQLIEIQGEERVQEIARMLAGDSLTDVSLEHARQLINEDY